MPKRSDMLNAGLAKEPPLLPEVYRPQIMDTTSGFREGEIHPNKGIVNQAALSEFLMKINEDLIPIIGKRQKEAAKKDYEKGKGIARVTLTDETDDGVLSSWADAIKNGHVSESESPHFVEGYNDARAAQLAEKYHSFVEGAYTKWEKINDPDIKGVGFHAWLEQQDNSFARNLEGMPDSSINNHFLPLAMGSRRQLLQKNTAYQQKMFKNNAYNTHLSTFKSLLDSFGAYSDADIAEILEGADATTLQQLTQDHQAIHKLLYSNDVLSEKKAIKNLHAVRKINPDLARKITDILLEGKGKKANRPNEGEGKSTHSYTPFTSLEPMVSVANIDQAIQFSFDEFGNSLNKQEEVVNTSTPMKEDTAKSGDSISTLYMRQLGLSANEATRQGIFNKPQWKKYKAAFIKGNSLTSDGLKKNKTYQLPPI